MSKKGVVQVGQRYGRLVTLRPTEHRYRKSVVWECQCDCGNITEVSAVFLKGGHKKSCGCKYHNRQLVKNGVVYSVEEISKLAGISPSVVYYHIAMVRLLMI